MLSPLLRHITKLRLTLAGSRVNARDSPGTCSTHDAVDIADIEKGGANLAPSIVVGRMDRDGNHEASVDRGGWKHQFKAFETRLVRYNLETRGIQRVLPHQRHDTRQLGFVQICVLWIGINLTANNLTLGMLYVALLALNVQRPH